MNKITFSPEFYAFVEKLKTDNALRNSFEACPMCGANIQDRVVSLYQGLIDALYQIYKWCGQHKKHEFFTKEIKYLLGKNEYARFGDMVRFGGIVYKPKGYNGESRKAWFGINMARAKEFFAGNYKIPVQIVLNPITNEIVDAHYVSVNDFPQLKELLTKEGLYDDKKQIYNDTPGFDSAFDAGFNQTGPATSTGPGILPLAGGNQANQRSSTSGSRALA